MSEDDEDAEQAALLLWLAEFDAWEAMSEQEREKRIKWEMRTS